MKFFCLTTLLISLFTMFSQKFDTRRPHGEILLLIFTLSVSIIASYNAVYYLDPVFSQMLTMQFAGILGALLYCFVTKDPFRFTKGSLYALGFLLATYLGYWAIFQERPLVQSLIFAILLTIYLIGDTILLMRGAAFCFTLTRERYYVCAVSFHIDIVNIFIFLVSMLVGD